MFQPLMTIKFFPVNSQLSGQHTVSTKLVQRIATSKPEHVPEVKKSETECLEWIPEENRLIVVSRNGTVRLWRTDRMIEEHSFTGSWIWAEVCPDAQHLFAAVSWDGKLKVVDTRALSTALEHDLKKIHGDKFDKLLYCTWNRNGKLAIITRGDLIHIIDPTTGEVDRTIQPGMDIYSAVFDAQNRLWVAAGGTPGKLLVYDESDTPRELVAHAHSVMSISKCHADGKEMIVSGGADALVCLWDPVELACIRTFAESISPVTTLACSSDGALVAWGSGGSKDGECVLSIAGVQTGHHYSSIQVPSPVTRVKWNSAGNAIAYSMLDGGVKVISFPASSDI
jgi:WD40 repeat protein